MIVKCLVGKKLVIVFILRVGLGMIDGVLSFVFVVRVGYIGLYRDLEIFEVVEYFVKMF